MKAIILNSGIGKRMHPFTENNPKCLLKLNGKTILGHELENLLKCGIKSVIITTGQFHEKIKKFVSGNFPEVNATYVKNKKYDLTNYIYSMWLTKGLIDDEIILLHGDMVFERELLENLLNDKHPNCVLVNKNIKPPEKDFKGEIKNNLVTKISVSLFGKNAFFLAPIYKFSKNDFRLWLEAIEKFVKEGNVNVYAEEAFNEMPNKIRIHPVYFENEFCMEIDNFDDLEIAKEFFKIK